MLARLVLVAERFGLTPHQLRHLHCRSAARCMRHADDPWRNSGCVGVFGTIHDDGSCHNRIAAWAHPDTRMLGVDSEVFNSRRTASFPHHVSTMTKQASSHLRPYHRGLFAQRQPAITPKFSHSIFTVSVIQHGGSATCPPPLCYRRFNTRRQCWKLDDRILMIAILFFAISFGDTFLYVC